MSQDDLAVARRRVALCAVLVAPTVIVAAVAAGVFSSGPATAVAAAPPSCASPLPEPPTIPTTRVQCVVAPWVILEVGADHRSLVIDHGPVASCSDYVGPAIPQITKVRGGVRISLVQRMRVTGLDDACVRRQVIHLRVRLHSQRILGQAALGSTWFTRIDYLTRWVPDPPYSNEGLPLVPRVVGLSVAEARAVLRREGFRARVLGHGQAVVSQSPRRGHLAPGSTTKHPYSGTGHPRHGLVAGSPRAGHQEPQLLSVGRSGRGS